MVKQKKISSVVLRIKLLKLRCSCVDSRRSVMISTIQLDMSLYGLISYFKVLILHIKAKKVIIKQNTNCRAKAMAQLSLETL